MNTTATNRQARYKTNHPEKVQESQRRYDSKRRDSRARDRAEEKDRKFRALTFVAWDGEGSQVDDDEPQPYMLFGNTAGLSIQAPQLGTEECLELICKGDPGVINFSFAFTYDVNQICWQIPRRRMYALSRGRRIVYNGYLIEWAPAKWFAVKRNRKGEKWVKIFDCFHFFNKALTKVLDEYQIGSPEIRAYLDKMKSERSQFTWEEIEEVKEYWTIEGQLMVLLMEYVRDIFADAGFYISTWHGPGALARHLLRTHDVKKAQANIRSVHPEVWLAARYAFSAGRFEQFGAGLHIGPVWNWDIHSAFPYAIQFLPDLNKGWWEHSLRPDRNRIRHDRYALYLIRYDARDSRESENYGKWRPHPLFRRLKNDNICWPDRVNGWYWSPEAELVKDDPNAEIVESWEFHGDGSRPMAWIAEIYRTREYHKRLGNVIEYPFKLGMNSCYGQFAQRAGWQNVRNEDGSRGGPPPFHQIEWAGYITSMCKSMVYRVALWAYDAGGLITIDTDGIFATVRVPTNILPNGIGPELGQWEETEYEGILIWQNGFYWLKKDGEWSKAKSRGAPRGTIPIDKAWEALPGLDKICYTKHMFTSFGKAIQTDFLLWRSWQTLPYEVKFGGTGKRQHGRRSCPKCVKDQFGIEMTGWEQQLHILQPAPPHATKAYQEGDDHWSLMHNLPWINRKEERAADLIFDPEEDEIWEDYTL